MPTFWIVYTISVIFMMMFLFLQVFYDKSKWTSDDFATWVAMFVASFFPLVTTGMSVVIMLTIAFHGLKTLRESRENKNA